MMKNDRLKVSLFIFLFSGATSQLICNQCASSVSSEGDCGNVQKCSSTQTRCIAIRWGNYELGRSSPNTFETRCATAHECSEFGIRQLCARGQCVAQCCSTSKCDPYSNEKMNMVWSGGRTFRCYQCSRESLDSCIKTEQICDDDQDACASFLIEGGNAKKVYTKRCARKDECYQSELNRLCEMEKDMSNQKQCRSSCCFDEVCNTSSFKTISLFLLICAYFVVVLVA